MEELVMAFAELPRESSMLVRRMELDGILTVCGVAGALLYLTSFAAVQSGRMRGDGVAYALVNTVAALLVLSSLSVSFNAGAFIIQTSFATIGATAIILKLRSRRRLTRERPSAVAPSRP